MCIKLIDMSIKEFWVCYKKELYQLLFVVAVIKYCAGGKIETNEMGRARGAYGGG